MGTFLVSCVVLTVLSSSCASPDQLLTCNDLTRIQRGTEEALKEIAQAQRQKEVDQCQTLDENQAKVKLAVAELEGRLEQGLNDRLALDQMERGRLDEIEAKVDTQVDQLSSSLKTIRASSEERLQAIEDRLKAMQVETLQTLESLGRRLGVIEERVDTQVNKTGQLEANHTRYEEELQPTNDTMKAIEEQLTEVATRPACQPPFEGVGDDCVHFHDVWMTWADARRYCQDLGGDLLEPANKTGFVLDGSHPMSEPHPPLFDFLERKGELFDFGGIMAWVGASVDGAGSEATWTSGQALLRGDYRIRPRECIAVEVWSDGGYITWSLACDNIVYPLCHSL